MTSKKAALARGLLAGMMVGAILYGVLAGTAALLDLSWYHFEDGSFRLTGCNPFALCSDIGIDTPWEDLLPYPLDQAAYYLVQIIFK